MGIRRPIAVLLLAACLSLLMPSAPVLAMVAHTSLSSMTTAADSILVGKVLRVVEVRPKPLEPGSDPVVPVRIAEVEVRELIKGASRPKRVWYLATGTWTSDRSDAVTGETALFFLEEVGRDPESWARLAQVFGDDRIREAIAAETGKAPFYRLSWSGYGRAPLLDIDGRAYAKIWTGTVRLPRDMTSIAGPDPRYTRFIRCVPLDEVRRCIDRRLTWTTAATTGKAAEILGYMRDLDEDFDAADEAVDALGEIGEAGVPVLFGVIEDAASPWREGAAAALLCLGPCGEAAIATGLGSENAARRRAAAFALECAATRGMRGENELFPLARGALTHADPDVRRRAVAAMGAWVEDGPLAAVVAALEDEDLGVRRSAARALVGIRGMFDIQEEPPFERTERGLLPLTKHEDVAVRREAWEALAFTAGPATRPAALRGIEGPDRIVRMFATIALGRTGGVKAAEVLVASLGSPDAWTRRTAAYALGEGKIAAGVGALIAALDDTDEDVAHISIQALGKLGPKAASSVPALKRRREETKSSHTRSLIDDALKGMGKD